jgi:hypothetical protein
MQFTAEIAPPGREGSYIALAYLPFFGAKFIAGPMAGILLTSYAPEFGIDGEYGNYPDHQMIWVWVGVMAALTPVGLVGFRKVYRAAEERAAAAAAAAASTGEGELVTNSGSVIEEQEAPTTIEATVNADINDSDDSADSDADNES